MTQKTKRTESKLAELKQLHDEGCKNIFRRIQLADEILSDTAWIASAFDGQEDVALKALEDDYFTDYRGWITVGEMRKIYQWCRIESKWAEYKYDLAAMQCLYDEAHPKETTNLVGSRTKWKKIAEEKTAELEQLKADRRKDQKELNEVRDEANSLRAEIQRLRMENAELKGRISELEKLMDRNRAAVSY